MPREGLALLEPIIKMADDKSACVKSETKQVYFELKLNFKLSLLTAWHQLFQMKMSFRQAVFFYIIIFA